MSFIRINQIYVTCSATVEFISLYILCAWLSEMKYVLGYKPILKLL